MVATIVTDEHLRATTSYTVVDSPVGPLTLSGNADALTSVWFDGNPDVLGMPLRQGALRRRSSAG